MGGSVVRSRRWLLLVAAVALLVPLNPAARADGPLDPVLGDPGFTYPDIKPDVTDVLVERQFLGFDPTTGAAVYDLPTLYFDTWAQNVGDVALDLMTDDPANVVNPAVSQCVSWYSPLVCRERRPVGGFELHPAHGHFHFNDFAGYELRRFDADGTPNYSAAGLVSASDKVSFCLIDATPIADDAFPVPTYVACGSTREGISAGWADIYTSDLEGQSLSAGGLVDGTYALVVTSDTANSVFESDDTNNRVIVAVQLTGLSTGTPQASIVGRTWPVLGTEDNDSRGGKKPPKGRGK
jgi:hypothetical protein